MLTKLSLAGLQAKEGDCDAGWMQVRTKLDVNNPIVMTLMSQYGELFFRQPPLATLKPGLLP